jgi:hypothetical protein
MDSGYTVMFGCKDRLILDYLVERFGTPFQRILDKVAKTGDGTALRVLQRRFYEMIQREALRQEWYSDAQRCNLGFSHTMPLRITVEIEPTVGSESAPHGI